MSPKVLDLAEQQFGMLTALSRLPVKEDGYFLWDCLCSCGGRAQVSTKKLMRRGATNCGCITKKTAANGPVSEDIAGRRFGLLTAVSREESKGGKTRWLCSCDCGETKKAFTSMLKSEQTWHCGCELEKTKRSTHSK